MRPAIHIDHTKRLWTILIENVNGLRFGNIDDFITPRRDELPGTAGRLTTRMRFEQIGFAVLIQGPGPGLPGNFALFGLSRKRRSRKGASALPVFNSRVRFRLGKDRPAVRLPET